jgi:ribosome-binding protein aMBF1 (putative translation factor)
MRGVPFQMDASRNAARPDEEYRAAWKAYLTPTRSKPFSAAGSPLGKLIQVERVKRGISRNELSRLIGATDGWYVTQIETGQIKMPTTYLRKISTVLAIPLPDLLTAAFDGMDADNEEKAA